MYKWCTMLTRPVQHGVQLADMKSKKVFNKRATGHSIGSILLHHFLGPLARLMIGVMDGTMVPNPPGFEHLFYCLGLEHLSFPMELCDNDKFAVPQTELTYADFCMMSCWKLHCPRFDNKSKKQNRARRGVGYVVLEAIEGKINMTDMHKKGVYTTSGELNCTLLRKLCEHMNCVPVPNDAYLDYFIHNPMLFVRATDSKHKPGSTRNPIIPLKQVSINKKRNWLEAFGN